MMEYDEFGAMNTSVLIAAEGERTSLKKAFGQVRHFVADSEARFSRFRDDSELSALNRAAGTWMQVSADMFELLEEAARAFHLTEGLFDPTILSALEAVGYDRSMDEIRELDSLSGQPGAIKMGPGFEGICLDPKKRSVRLPAEMGIDLGGIAKGWIASKAAAILARYTSAGAVSAGGDMVLFGLPQGERHWEISLEDPRDSDVVMAVLNVGPGAVATSSVTKRRWNQQGHTRHHIIDPRSQLPANSAWLSVTVMTTKATLAEAMAKAMLIAGPDKVRELAEKINNLRYVAVLPDGRMMGNARSKEVNLVYA